MRSKLLHIARPVIPLILLILFLSVPFVSAQGSLAAMVDELSQAVVLVGAFDANGELFATGTGTIVRADGIIFTNRHVIEGGSSFGIYMLEDPNEQPILRYYAVAVNVYDEIDFAVLQINKDENGRNLLPGTVRLPYIEFEPDTQAISDITRMTEIIVLGYPGIADYYLSTPRGFITSIQNLTIDDESYTVWYQTDAEIAPGHSGGIAVTLDGVPFGIATLVSSEERTGGRFGQILALPFAWDVANGEIILPQVETTPEPGGGQNTPAVTGAANEVWTCTENNRDMEFNNGTVVTVVQMRSGFTYRATVLGIGDFDPIIVVWSPDANDGFCSDDSTGANDYAVELPGIGRVANNRLGSQVDFQQPVNGLADMQLIIGGNTASQPSGEFVLIVEGLGVTDADNAGDPFQVVFTQSMVDSGVPVTAYMLGRERNLDPFLKVVFPENDQWVTLTDVDNLAVECDDAGTGSCWTDSDSLSGGFVDTSGGRVAGEDLDSVLRIEPAAALDAGFSDLYFLFNRFSGSRVDGQYIAVFHMGVR